jgi:hypothetical protein
MHGTVGRQSRALKQRALGHNGGGDRPGENLDLALSDGQQ